MNLEDVKQHPAVMRKHAVATVSANFLVELTTGLSVAQLDLCVLKNSLREPGEGIDYLHDFVDANQLMLNALASSFMGFEFDIECDFTRDLITEAWVHAGNLLMGAYGYKVKA